MIEPGSLEYRILTYFLLNETPLKPSELARVLQVPHQTIDSGLGRLQKEGYVQWKRYQAIELLEKGREELHHIETHLHLIEIYLMNTLGVSGSLAQEEARRLAPHFSCEIIKQICIKYAHPGSCPNHEKIACFGVCHTHEEVK